MQKKKMENISNTQLEYALAGVKKRDRNLLRYMTTNGTRKKKRE